MPITAKILDGVIMEIKRDKYLNRLIVRKHNGFIKIITGIRRSGKSYLLNTLFYNHLVAENTAPNHIIKFAFDSAEDLIRIVEKSMKPRYDENGYLMMGIKEFLLNTDSLLA